MLKSINQEQGLYVIGEGDGYSCLDFQVCEDRLRRLANELDMTPPAIELGTAEHYQQYLNVMDVAQTNYSITKKPFTCELSPQLIGLEGWRVEAVDEWGETVRFIVGKSTGWIPIHLAISRRTSIGGMAAWREYKSVRRLYKSR